MKKNNNILPLVLTSVAFFMGWSVVLFGTLAFYVIFLGPLIVNSGFLGDISSIILFYGIISFFVIILGAWFYNKFFEISNKK